ncbi:uncharacterized protein LOC134222858 [Armigeres subalbatus]|uniref:uncharacterized protein LOC134222858 n=1 Tax=Armigeres subalbatus TaxID=124917 RepID=UPI002ED44320
MNPSDNNQHYGSYNPAPPSQESYAVYSPPSQSYQQQFPQQGFVSSHHHSVPDNNPGQTLNMSRMTTPGLYQHTQPSAIQQPNTGSFPAGGIQYFMDAACTVPAGSLPHQPQALNQFPPHQQRALMSQAASLSQPERTLSKQSQCVNPNCTHCCKPQTAPAGPNPRRQ